MILAGFDPGKLRLCPKCKAVLVVNTSKRVPVHGKSPKEPCTMVGKTLRPIGAVNPSEAEEIRFLRATVLQHLAMAAAANEMIDTIRNREGAQ